MNRLVAELWPFCTFCTIHTKSDFWQGLRKSKSHISASSRPIWLKIWPWTIWNILLWPYEAIFCPISTPSMLSNFNGSEQKKGGVQWNFTFLAKVCYEVDLITNFLAKLSSNKVYMIPYKAQVSNPSGWGDTALPCPNLLSVYSTCFLLL